MEIPENIGNYRIECLLGSGGMADVYLATHVLLNKQVAIKVMKPQLSANDPMMAKRFVREAQLAQKVDHPNIVKVFDVGCDEKTGLLYIVMEYVEGMNLSDYSRNGDVSSDDIRAIAHEMTQALIALQEMGIVHRDIKPSNIMLCNDGSLKLMDLGIAKALHPGGESEATLTVEQAVLGTPAYSSPEQCMNSKTVDIRSDIYCLGASLYAIASGRVPYGGTTAMEILLKVLENKPQPLAEIRPDLDADLIALIEWMMEKSPKKRPQTPQKLLKALVTKKTPGKWKKYVRIAIFAVVAIILAPLLNELVTRYAPELFSKFDFLLVEPFHLRKRPKRISGKPLVKQGTIMQKTNAVKSDSGKRAATRVTLEQRLSDVEAKLTKDHLQTKYIDSEISAKILELAKQEEYVSSHFDEFKALVHQVQRFRVKEQIKQYEFAKNLDESKFDANATRKVQESIAAFTKKVRWDMRNQNRDLEFSENLLKVLKTGRINPNVHVFHSANSSSGPLLFTLLSSPFEKNKELISELLKQGADANEVQKRENNQLMGNSNFLMIMANGGVNRLENKLIPLLRYTDSSFYAESAYKSSVKDFILLNHDVSEKDNQGNTALHYAVRYGLFDIAALLLASGADVNEKNIIGETPLFEAVKSIQPTIEKLFLGLGADTTVRNKDGKTALTYRELGLFMKAVQKGDLKAMRMYLDKGLSPNIQLQTYYGLPLHYACDKHNWKMVELLLEYKADTENSMGGSCLTPIERSVGFSGSSRSTDDLKIFTLLLKHGANHIKSYENIFDPKKREYLSILLEHIKEFKEDDPILAFAIAADLPDDTIQLLIDKKANVNCPSTGFMHFYPSNNGIFGVGGSESFTPLYIAVGRQRSSTVKLLLKYGADKEWVSRMRRSIRDLNTSDEIKALLR